MCLRYMLNIILFSYIIYTIFYIFTFNGIISSKKYQNPYYKFKTTSYLFEWYYIILLIADYGLSLGLCMLLTFITKYYQFIT